MKSRILQLFLAVLIVEGSPLPALVFTTVHLPITTTTTTTEENTIHTWNNDKKVWRWIPEEYPSPHHIPIFCRRYKPSYICDPDGVLSQEELDSLDKQLVDIRNETSCACKQCPPKLSGMSVGVALMKNVFMPFNTSTSEIMKNFAKRLQQSWNISTCGDQIIIIFVTDQNLSYTSIGPGLVDKVTREATDRIMMESKPYFIEGLYFDGLKVVTNEYNTLLHGILLGAGKSEQTQNASSTGLIVGLIVGLTVVALLVGTIIVVHRSRSKRYNPKDAIATSSNSWNRKDAVTTDRPFYLGTPSNGVYQPCSTADEALQSSGAESDVPQDSYEPMNTEDEDEQPCSRTTQQIPCRAPSKHSSEGETPTKFIDDDDDTVKESSESRLDVAEVHKESPQTNGTKPTETTPQFSLPLVKTNGVQSKETDIV